MTITLKSDTSNLEKSLKNLIRSECDLTIIVHYLRQAYFAKNIDNLLGQLVGPTSNYISTFIFHSVLYITNLCLIFDSNSLMTYVF